MGKPRPQRGERGIWKHKANPDDPDLKVADFSYQNEELAKLIAKAWTDNVYRGKLLDHTTAFAKTELENRGVKLTHPVVLTEDEYDNGWQLDHKDEVVFVLPNASRAQNVAAADLLETAKFLMACVPKGI
jgi:hypothetical protein